MRIDQLKAGQLCTMEYSDGTIYKVLNTSVKMHSLIGGWEAAVVYANTETEEQYCIKLDKFLRDFLVHEKPSKKEAAAPAKEERPQLKEPERVEAVLVSPVSQQHIILEAEIH